MDTNNFVALDFETATARSAWFGFSGKENELWNAERDETKRIIRFIRIRVVL